MKAPRLISLNTDFEKDLNASAIPFSEYPRPQLKRDSYLCLNGLWDFYIKNGREFTYAGQILVPFVPESRISGVMCEIKPSDTLIYERKFELKKEFISDRILLHIGACDQSSSVYINNKKVGENIGGYLPFSFDITDFIFNSENTVRVEASDPLDKELPYGKQTDKRGGMWYTKVSGIWQTVWLESVPENYIKSIKITPDLKGVDIEVFGGKSEKTLIFEGKTYSFCSDKFRLEIEDPILWTPEDPHLYYFTLSSGSDTVSSYFGLRTVGIQNVASIPLIHLNGEPVFCHGLLDQGYFSDGIFSPASARGFKEDILRMKQCGFNMLRKHIKLEPDLFYYYCDKYGMLVFQDMINSGKYSFLLDTALPTAFLKKGIFHKATKRREILFEQTCTGIISSLYNHPSVIYYTIFNEGWGQFSADEFYKKFKSLDPSRIYDSTSGWFKETLSDVESEHIYFKPIKFKSAKLRPLVLSEFGGYCCKIKDHAFNLDKTYGYRHFEETEQLESALVDLYEKQIIPNIEHGLCATVLTQLSDVEDETNGLLTFDRKVLKVNSDNMSRLSQKLYSKFKECFSPIEKRNRI